MFNTQRHPTHPLILLIFLLRIQASPGDYSPGYQRCVNECNFRQCYIVDSDPHQLPFSLRFFHWTCPDDCSYRCMHDLTEKVLKLPIAIPPPDQPFEGWWDEPDWTPGVELEGLPPGRIVQFHGKWPFKRWHGIQEPLSALFSIFNLLTYLFSYYQLKRIIPHSWPLRTLYLGNTFVGMNAWIWSTIFHCRDKPWTERLDYFNAAAYTLYGLYLACVRIFRLYPTKAKHHLPLELRLYYASQLKSILSAMFLAHIAFLSAGERFNYKYNMFVNVAVGVATILLWLTWTASHSYLRKTRSGSQPSSPQSPTDDSASDTNSPTSPSDLNPSFSSRLAQTLESMATTTTTGTVPPYINSPLLPLICLVGAGLLELLDFPPVLNMSLDAHALWHLSTIPLGWAWCVGVLGRDAKWESQFVEGILDDHSKGSEVAQEGTFDENSGSSNAEKLASQ
ncbi:Per1-like-domain-containing protein [Melampsora americana]|nr:Per1-like-domain-containing protein [Melampsora americana]